MRIIAWLLRRAVSLLSRHRSYEFLDSVLTRVSCTFKYQLHLRVPAIARESVRALLHCGALLHLGGPALTRVSFDLHLTLFCTLLTETCGGTCRLKVPRRGWTRIKGAAKNSGRRWNLRPEFFFGEFRGVRASCKQPALRSAPSSTTGHSGVRAGCKQPTLTSMWVTII
jgi:hypothetical protein